MARRQHLKFRRLVLVAAAFLAVLLLFYIANNNNNDDATTIQMESASSMTTSAPAQAQAATPTPTTTSLTSQKEQIDTLLKDVQLLQERINAYGSIRNRDKFPRLAPNHIPIVLFVFKRPHYFRQVIEHLRNVSGIEETILIVSHDAIDKEMFDLFDSIDFCQVKQLLHPLAGTKRDSTPAIKYHWWWVMKMVWDELRLTETGDIMFLEEDHVLSPDAYRTMQYLVTVKREQVPGVFTATLGSGNTDPNADPYLVDVCGGFNNMAYAFNRSAWELLKRNAEEFMRYKEAWDYSLFHLQQLRLIPDLSIVPRLARMKNIGEFGTNVNKAEYDRIGLGNVVYSKRITTEQEWHSNGHVATDRLCGSLPKDNPYHHPIPPEEATRMGFVDEKEYGIL